MKKVLLALSGGVDSSTAAVILQRRGVDIVGCTMQLWDARKNPAVDGVPRVGRCCSLDDAYDARKVAEQLQFPFYVLNFEKEFERRVVEPFIKSYLHGETPIPCTACNTFLKFDKLVSFAEQIGIETVATGHYARIIEHPEHGFMLFRGLDQSKDQSYYLFELSQAQLARTEFPVGEHTKDEIRRIAASEGLATASKPESQEICFVPDNDYSSFIRRNASEVNEGFLTVLQRFDEPGPIVFKDGSLMGQHSGIYHYTVGQRKGLGIAHPRPLYVMRLEAEKNSVVVGYKEDVYGKGLVAERVNWISAVEPDQKEFQASVRVRSNHRAAKASIELFREEGGLSARIVFDQPQLAITPGQAAVIYCGERVLGGGWITERIV